MKFVRVFLLGLLLSFSTLGQVWAEEPKVNINTATAQQLEKALPGIGDKKAQAIVEYREAYGYFNSVDQLANISGIGTKTVDKLRGLVEIDVPLEHELEKRSAD